MTIDWSALDHAYGSAADVGDLIRDAAAGDGEALSELFGSIVHQGTLYTATPVALPLVLDLAADPGTAGRVGLLHLAGAAAESRDADDQVLADVQAVLAAKTPLVLPLLADRDDEVRAAAVHLAGHLPSGGVPLETLRARYAAEATPVMRASLLAAAARLHPEDAAPWLASAFGEDDDAVRAGAAWAVAVNGLPWPEGATAAVVTALRADDPFGGGRWMWSYRPLDDIFDSLPLDDALGLGRAMLADGPGSAVRALAAVAERCRVSRSAQRAFAPLFLEGLAHPDAAVRLAGSVGARAAGRLGEAVRALAGFVADPPPAALNEPDSAEARLLDSALLTMMLAGDQRWRGPLAAVLSAGRRVTGAPGEDFRLNALELLIVRDEAPDPALLAAVRALLPDSGAARLLAHWGPAAAPAVPELAAASRTGDVPAARALASIGPAAAAAVPDLLAAPPSAPRAEALFAITGDPVHLHEFVATAAPVDAARLAAAHGLDATARLDELRAAAGGGGAAQRTAAAALLLDLTGDTSVAVDTAREVLAAHALYRDALDLAARLGPAALPLADALRAAATSPFMPDIGAGITLHRLTGDAAPLLHALADRLRDRRADRRLEDAVAELGDAIAPLVPLIRETVEGDAPLYFDDGTARRVLLRVLDERGAGA
ncbi:hypothetical protein [Actinomadura parmotrematis]|uniref:HEAT repeat domain-containing protein n=1 Tax=Actinomadura parmotrematis TaxID=2864039 RepID=A0ABS7G252_9ACTN|nr:hypothetical protein [Actinomadura parmotrematis]MBW8486783.1 hypothetical protein [Actinomadura parmotrematis]